MASKRRRLPQAVVNPKAQRIWVLPQNAHPDDAMTPEQILDAERQLGIKSPWHDAAVAAVAAKKKPC